MIRTSTFSTYHPIVNFIYFGFVIGFSMVFMHPVCLIVSLASGFLYSVMLKGRKAIKSNLLYMLPLLIITALMNPAFNHEGITILAYLPSGNPLTLESIVYGLAAAVMLISVICHFSCYNEVMTSDKFIYLFGRIIPSLALLLSMTFRFVPRLITQLKAVANAQRLLGRDMRAGGILRRAKNGLTILSILVTRALENAIETADSMKSRGYGIAGRTAFSVFRFDRRDRAALVCILAFGLYVLSGDILGKLQFAYFPAMTVPTASVYSISIFLAYFALCAMPIIIEVWEVWKWKSIQSKI